MLLAEELIGNLGRRGHTGRFYTKGSAVLYGNDDPAFGDKDDPNERILGHFVAATIDGRKFSAAQVAQLVAWTLNGEAVNEDLLSAIEQGEQGRHQDELAPA